MARRNENNRAPQPAKRRRRRRTNGQRPVQQKKKQSRGSKIVSNIIFIVALGVFAFSAYKLYTIYSEYKAGEQEYTQIADEVKKDKTIDFDKLEKTNPDVIGWLEVTGTNINYPIVQAADNDYYLNRTFEKQYNSAGAIFVDKSNKDNFTDPNTIIYGHNMKNGTMFAKLSNYVDKSYFDAHRTVIIYTRHYTYTYEVFSAYVTKADGETYTLFSGFGTNYNAYIQRMKALSYFNTNTKFKSKDPIITLSTCTEATGPKRTVAQAKLVKEEPVKRS